MIWSALEEQKRVVNDTTFLFSPYFSRNDHFRHDSDDTKSLIIFMLNKQIIKSRQLYKPVFQLSTRLSISGGFLLRPRPIADVNWLFPSPLRFACPTFVALTLSLQFRIVPFRCAKFHTSDAISFDARVALIHFNRSTEKVINSVHLK